MIEIKRWDNGEVIHSGDFSSVKECLEDGIRKEIDFWRANMCGANMRDADMRGANMCDANMRGANMRGANMRGADMCDANMCGADMRGANMRDADMRGANMCDADMRGAVGSNSRVSSMQHGPYSIVVVDDICHGGCTTKTLQEWLEYDGEELNAYDKNYLEVFTKPFIKMVIASRDSGDSDD